MRASSHFVIHSFGSFVCLVGLVLAPMQLNAGSESESSLPKTVAAGIHKSTSVVRDDVKMTLTVPTEQKAGLGLSVEVTIVNMGERDVIVGTSTSRLLPFSLTISRKGVDQIVPFTTYGQKWLAPSDVRDMLRTISGSHRRTHVGPGAALTLSIPNLALLYDLTLPAEYEIVIGMKVTISGADSSRMIEFDRVPLRFQISNP